MRIKARLLTTKSNVKRNRRVRRDPRKEMAGKSGMVVEDGTQISSFSLQSVIQILNLNIHSNVSNDKGKLFNMKTKGQQAI